MSASEHLAFILRVRASLASVGRGGESGADGVVALLVGCLFLACVSDGLGFPRSPTYAYESMRHQAIGVRCSTAA